MATYGTSGTAPGATAEEAIASHGAAIESMADQLMWLRRKVASSIEDHVEPEDIEAEDATRNAERTS
jgi:hypothetical protein